MLVGRAPAIGDCLWMSLCLFLSMHYDKRVQQRRQMCLRPTERARKRRKKRYSYLMFPFRRRGRAGRVGGQTHVTQERESRCLAFSFTWSWRAAPVGGHARTHGCRTDRQRPPRRRPATVLCLTAEHGKRENRPGAHGSAENLLSWGGWSGYRRRTRLGRQWRPIGAVEDGDNGVDSNCLGLVGDREIFFRDLENSAFSVCRIVERLRALVEALPRGAARASMAPLSPSMADAYARSSSLGSPDPFISNLRIPFPVFSASVTWGSNRKK